MESFEEDRLAKDITEGHEAEALLANPLLKKTFEYLDTSYTQAWKAAKTPELREQAWYTIHALERVQQHLQGTLTSGRLADREIQDLVRRRKRA